MKRHLKRIALVLVLAAGVGVWGLLMDSQALYDGLVRLHVVGASDGAADQAVKLKVRDAVLASLEQGLQDLTDVDAAVCYVQQMLPQVEAAANQALEAAGVDMTAAATFLEEAFPTREYDTFSLPAGVYKALRVVIGEGEGKNWWCVVFPNLCMGTKESFVETAAVAGMPQTLRETLEGEYEIRFWLLERIGELKNTLFASSD